MSIYKGYGGYGSPAQNANVMDELMESYENAKEHIGELGARIIELEDENKALRKRNNYLEDARSKYNKKIQELKLDIEDYNSFGTELLIDLMVSFYDSKAMHEFEKCFDKDELDDMKIEADYILAEMLKEEEDE